MIDMPLAFLQDTGPASVHAYCLIHSSSYRCATKRNAMDKLWTCCQYFRVYIEVKGQFSCIKSVQTLSSAEIRTETTVFFMQSLNTTRNSFPLFWVSETLRCYSFRQHCCFFSTNIGIFLYLSGFFKIEVQFVPSWLGMNRFSVLTPLSPRLLMCNCSCQWQYSLYLFCSWHCIIIVKLM